MRELPIVGVNPRTTPSPEELETVVAMSKRLIDGKHPGILTTVDGMGRPHTRWMATLAFDEFPQIYTLTASISRKMSQIAMQPAVEWMFSEQDLSLILNLSGKAQIVTDIREYKRLWGMIADKSKAYFLNNMGVGAECSILKTVVQRIECCMPDKNVRWEMDVDSYLDGQSMPSARKAR